MDFYSVLFLCQLLDTRSSGMCMPATGLNIIQSRFPDPKCLAVSSFDSAAVRHMANIIFFAHFYLVSCCRRTNMQISQPWNMWLALRIGDMRFTASAECYKHSASELNEARRRDLGSQSDALITRLGIYNFYCKGCMACLGLRLWTLGYIELCTHVVGTSLCKVKVY